MRSFDWESLSTEILFNPRMPQRESDGVESRLRGLCAVPAHFWVASSGSTAASSGELKWVALSKAAVLASARAVNEHLGAGANDTWIHALPDFHVGGVGILARAWLAGSRVIDGLDGPGRKWDALRFHGIAVASGATLSALVPAQVHDLVTLGLASPPALRAVIVGGGAISAALADRARGLGWKLLPSYGLTECCSQVATAALDPSNGTSGLPLLAHVEARIAADGRIELKSPSLLTGYATLGGDPTRDRWIAPVRDGWFRTEDLGEMPGRSLLVRGRSGDFIKVGGESVDLARLDRVLEEIRLSCPATLDLALVAVPDERLGHVVHGAFAAESADRARELFDRFNESVLPFERARAVHALGRLPRSPLGKLLKGELLQLILSARSPRAQSR